MEFVGRTVNKEVNGVGVISGTVKSYDPSSGFVEILYEDGDSVELELSDVVSLLEAEPELAKVKPRVGRKPKKRRRFERKGEAKAKSGNVIENSVAEGSEFRGVLDGNGSAGGNSVVNGELGSGIERELDVGNGNGSVNANESEETLGKGIGFEENLNKGVSANGNWVKDGLDLNARINLNEDLNLNDGCSSPFDDRNTEVGLKRRDSIDLNLDVNNEDDVNLNAGGGTLWQRECNFDLNVEVCEDFKETQGDADGNGHYEANALFGKTGQLQEKETDINRRSIEDPEVNGNINGVSDAIKLEVNHVSMEHDAKDASLCLIEEKEGDDEKGAAPGSDSLQVSNAISVKDCDSAEAQQTDSPSEAGFIMSHEYQDDPGSLCKQGSDQRKRRKLADNLKTTPETVLRRSSRRASARKQVSSTTESQVIDDPSLPMGPSASTEEIHAIPGYEQCDQSNVAPSKLQLPPSSQNLNLDDVPVLELFSI